MGNTICDAMFADPDAIPVEDEDDDDEPEMIEHQARFSRSVYSTEFCSVTFEAPEGADSNEINELAWAAYNAERYNDWYSGDCYDTGDTELDDVEET